MELQTDHHFSSLSPSSSCHAPVLTIVYNQTFYRKPPKLSRSKSSSFSSTSSSSSCASASCAASASAITSLSVLSSSVAQAFRKTSYFLLTPFSSFSSSSSSSSLCRRENETHTKTIVSSSCPFHRPTNEKSSEAAVPPSLDSYRSPVFDQAAPSPTEAKKESTEVFLDPDFVYLRVYSLLANLKVHFLPLCYPYTYALGSLPSAVLHHNKVLNGSRLRRFLQRERDINAHCVRLFPSSSSGQGSSSASLSSSFSSFHFECLMLSTFFEVRLKTVLNYVLWCFEPCYTAYTRRVYLQSMPYVYAYLFLYFARRRIASELADVDLNEVLSCFIQILERIPSGGGEDCSTAHLGASSTPDHEGRAGDSSSGGVHTPQPSTTATTPISNQPKFLLGHYPTSADIQLYSYLSVLFQIPMEVTPWHGCVAYATKDPLSSSSPSSSSSLSKISIVSDGSGTRRGREKNLGEEKNGDDAEREGKEREELREELQEETEEKKAEKEKKRKEDEEAERKKDIRHSDASTYSSFHYTCLPMSKKSRSFLSEEFEKGESVFLLSKKLALLIPRARSYLRDFDDFLVMTATSMIDAERRKRRRRKSTETTKSRRKKKHTDNLTSVEDPNSRSRKMHQVTPSSPSSAHSTPLPSPGVHTAVEVEPAESHVSASSQDAFSSPSSPEGSGVFCFSPRTVFSSSQIIMKHDEAEGDEDAREAVEDEESLLARTETDCSSLSTRRRKERVVFYSLSRGEEEEERHGCGVEREEDRAKRRVFWIATVAAFSIAALVMSSCSLRGGRKI